MINKHNLFKYLLQLFLASPQWIAWRHLQGLAQVRVQSIRSFVHHTPASVLEMNIHGESMTWRVCTLKWTCFQTTKEKCPSWKAKKGEASKANYHKCGQRVSGRRKAKCTLGLCKCCPALPPDQVAAASSDNLHFLSCHSLHLNSHSTNSCMLNYFKHH